MSKGHLDVFDTLATFYYEDAVTLHCDLGYVIDGNLTKHEQTSLCQADGSWSPSWPQCQSVYFIFCLGVVTWFYFLVIKFKVEQFQNIVETNMHISEGVFTATTYYYYYYSYYYYYYYTTTTNNKNLYSASIQYKTVQSAAHKIGG